MFSMKKIALSLALVGAAASASAMTAVSDDELRNTVGQDGVSIAAQLNVNVGEFKYTDTDATGGSISFNNIKTTGLIGLTIDILSGAAFQSTIEATFAAGYIAGGATAPVAAALAGAQYAGLVTAGFVNTASDVVQIAFPVVPGFDTNFALSQKVSSITMGGSSASLGSIEMNRIDLQGTRVWIWAH